MPQRSRFFLLCLCLGTTVLQNGLHRQVSAQGTEADYQRAGQLESLTRNTLFRNRVEPHWIAGGDRFWYRVTTSPRSWEFVLVDAATGARRPAFDHLQLTDALNSALSSPAGARLSHDRLDLNDLDFTDPQAITFTTERRRWRWHIAENRLEGLGAARDQKETSARVLSAPEVGSRTGSDTSLLFLNRTDKPVTVYWINSLERPTLYATLEPGAEHDQHTFAGHTWLVRGAEGQLLGVYAAIESPAVVVIDGRGRFEGSSTVDRERRGRRSRGTPSPDGQWAARIEDHNLIVEQIQSRERVPLTTQGTAENAFVPRFWWSPDSSYLLVMQQRQGDRRQIHFVESSPADQVQPKLHTLEYAKPGDEIDQSWPRLFRLSDRSEIPIPQDLFSNPWNITQLRWEPDSSRFTFLYNQRGHQVLRVIAVDAASGHPQVLIDETSDTFLCYSSKTFLRFLEEANEIVWMSERDGWNHLYLFDASSGALKRQLTQGAWVVRGVDHLDEQNRQLWMTVGGIDPLQDPYHLHYCRVDLDTGSLTRLTFGDGTHRVEFSPDRKTLIDTYSRVDLPPVTELRNAETGSLLGTLETADWSALLQTGWQIPERFVAPGRDGTTPIYGVIYRPTNFDESRSYPVIEQIYAGPHSAHVPKAFQALHRSQQQLAELGFIVVQIDGMGTSHRSKAFHDVCWKNLADAGFPDRIAWLKAAAVDRPWMDLSRVGIYGGSAGGQNALRALLSHGEFYKVAAADCGCHDNRMDKIWWNEQWMGWPLDESYERSSNVVDAHRLQGQLMLIVGELDRNVDPASTMQVVNALVKADKDFDLLVIPGAGHGAGGGHYGRRRQWDFFVRNLWNVEPRR